MEDLNIKRNLYIKQFNNSNAIAYNKDFLASSADYNFRILDNAYQPMVRVYAKTKLAIKNNNCESINCVREKQDLKILQEAPKKSMAFLEDLITQLSVTEQDNYDVNNSYKYLVAYSILEARPGFSITDGYNVNLELKADGSQILYFSGPMFVDEKGKPDPFIITNVSLQSLTDAGTDLVAPTPDIEKEMLELLTSVGLFNLEDIREDKTLSPTAKIKEEFILKNVDGSFDYEIIDIGEGKGRNVLKFDMDKINKKIRPFVNAEVVGLLDSEQETIAAWNVYIGKGTSVDEDDQMVQNANAGSESWSYEKDLPLSQDKKVLFEERYTKYFIDNYVKQFTINQFPTVEEDAAVFELEEGRRAKAQKFIDDNNL